MKVKTKQTNKQTTEVVTAPAEPVQEAVKEVLSEKPFESNPEFEKMSSAEKIDFLKEELNGNFDIRESHLGNPASDKLVIIIPQVHGSAGSNPSPYATTSQENANDLLKQLFDLGASNTILDEGIPNEKPPRTKQDLPPNAIIGAGAIFKFENTHDVKLRGAESFYSNYYRSVAHTIVQIFNNPNGAALLRSLDAIPPQQRSMHQSYSVLVQNLDQLLKTNERPDLMQKAKQEILQKLISVNGPVYNRSHILSIYNEANRIVHSVIAQNAKNEADATVTIALGGQHFTYENSPAYNINLPQLPPKNSFPTGKNAIEANFSKQNYLVITPSIVE